MQGKFKNEECNDHNWLNNQTSNKWGWSIFAWKQWIYLYLMQMKHGIWSYFVKRFFDNRPAWHWWGSYHHWDPWCQAKISVLGWWRRGDRHYRWYEQKRVRDISSLDFSFTKETLGRSVCVCRVRVKLRLLIHDGRGCTGEFWNK